MPRKSQQLAKGMPVKVIAVSGGVDSMSLLHMLSHTYSGVKYIVAHYNHGIRSDSDQDEQLVSETAKRYGLIFESGHGNLGPNASEAEARKVRYEFLRRIQKKYNAQSIVTAHHGDDLIETGLINISRGTGRRGLSSLRSSAVTERPLLHWSKQQIKSYAQEHQLKWREDSTNSDTSKLRNAIRGKLSKISEKQKAEIMLKIEKVAKINDKIDVNIATISQNITAIEQNRSAFIMLPDDIAREVMVAIFRAHKISDLRAQKVIRAVVFIKTSAAGTVMDIDGRTKLHVNTSSFWVETV